MANRFILNERSYHGKGAIQEIAGEVTSRGLKKALLCTDPDLLKFGVTKKVTDVLDAAGLAYQVYSEIKPNPTIENVQDGVEACQGRPAPITSSPLAAAPPWIPPRPSASSSPTPSSPTCAPWRASPPPRTPAVPIIAVPTTAGTAAEVTINYVITDVEKNRKFVCVDPHDIPVVAVVDPDMMASMPKGLTAATGMDALTHAIEGYITKGAWELSDMFHLKAIEIIAKSLRGAVDNDARRPRGHGSGPVHRRHGLLQRGPGHRPLHGTRPGRPV